MAFELGVAEATFIKFGIKFSGGGIPDPAVVSREDFAVYAIEAFFCDVRIAKAVTSWMCAHLGSLDESSLSNRISSLSQESKAVFAALLITVGYSGDSYGHLNLRATEPLQIRLAPFGEFGALGSPAFGAFNISTPALSPEPAKYLKPYLQHS